MTWIDDATADLDRQLSEAAGNATREHWERYLKGAAIFRGVPMAGTRKAVRHVWRGHGLEQLTTDDLLNLANHWFGITTTEDKLAAVLLITEHLAPRLELDHHTQLSEPFGNGDIGDWNVCDWYATKALHAYLTAGEDLEPRSTVMSSWTKSEDTTSDALWQRRAGLVAFVKLAPRAHELFDGFVPLVLDACANNLVSDDRFAHTGPGWVLRELSRCDPEAVAGFVEAHPGLSREARRMATARLREGPYRRR